MNIEIKNVKFGPEALSRETLNFVAGIYVDGKKIGFASNDGDGGCTEFHTEPFGNETNRAILKKAEEWAASLPPIKAEYGSLNMSLDLWVDEKVNDIWNEREKARLAKKLDKLCQKSIVVYNETSGESRQTFWKNRTVDDLLKIPAGIEMLKKALRELKPKLKEGEVIYNKNLAHLLAEIEKEK